MVAVTQREDGFYVIMKSKIAVNDTVQMTQEETIEETEWEVVPSKIVKLFLAVASHIIPKSDKSCLAARLLCGIYKQSKSATYKMV